MREEETIRTKTLQAEQFLLSIHPFTEINYQRSYSADSLILLFFTFSGIGWLWEVFLHIIEDKMIINRGVMTGPWLPIYGIGALLILLVLKKWRSRPSALFGRIILLCGTVEYLTSVGLELLFGVRWWDYSDMLFQFQGRICLGGTVDLRTGRTLYRVRCRPAFRQSVPKIISGVPPGTLCMSAGNLLRRYDIFHVSSQYGIWNYNLIFMSIAHDACLSDKYLIQNLSDRRRDTQLCSHFSGSSAFIDDYQVSAAEIINKSCCRIYDQ